MIRSGVIAGIAAILATVAIGVHAEPRQVKIDSKIFDRYVGYYKPYATSHEALDRDGAFQDEVRNATLTLMEAIEAKRTGLLVDAGSKLKEPRPK